MSEKLKTVKFGNYSIGNFLKPFIIAEMSANHNHSLDRAFAIIDAAADAGVQAIKLQTYTADTITMDNGFKIDDPNSLWKGRTLYDLYKEAYTPWEWQEKLFLYAQKKGLIAFSSPFDDTAVDFLEKLNVPLYKIASFENTHHPLIKKVAQTGKPVIMSTGVVSLEDLTESVDVLTSSGCNEFVLLKCTSTYPASPADSNIATIPDMSNRFGCPVGLSDHTLGVGVAVASVALGACVIEKHFTLNRADGGPDSAFSLEPHELKMLVQETTRAYEAVGKINYGVIPSEVGSLKFKQSLFIRKSIQKGEIITAEHLKVARPGLGLPPKYYDLIIGKKASVDMSAGSPVMKDSFLD